MTIIFSPQKHAYNDCRPPAYTGTRPNSHTLLRAETDRGCVLRIRESTACVTAVANTPAQAGRAYTLQEAQDLCHARALYACPLRVTKQYIGNVVAVRILFVRTTALRFYSTSRMWLAAAPRRQATSGHASWGPPPTAAEVTDSNRCTQASDTTPAAVGSQQMLDGSVEEDGEATDGRGTPEASVLSEETHPLTDEARPDSAQPDIEAQISADFEAAKRSENAASVESEAELLHSEDSFVAGEDTDVGSQYGCLPPSDSADSCGGGDATTLESQQGENGYTDGARPERHDADVNERRLHLVAEGPDRAPEKAVANGVEDHTSRETPLTILMAHPMRRQLRAHRGILLKRA
ncbi:unnamed protein product [Rangifer tarandus platyrhynchus]|uniref:Uncharacterized protein n=1 Tax=Rangifer tarandus platyrhynchus TaxID=3082113 RepID=A0ABN8XIK1_RANTA|nr:unnamed protein product [Rangifer tarandus platyrhynchus]